MSTRPKPVALIILDGWGYSEETENNAIAHAHSPVWDDLWASNPHTLVRTSGAAVGLPAGQMGNSEVGHLNIGAGRVVYQEFTRVSRAVKTGSFFTNSTLTDAVDRAVDAGKAVHIIGLLSPGGVHSHEKHIHAMTKLAVDRGADQVYLHAFTDGRDSPPESAASSIQAMDDVFSELGTGRIATLIGRYFAMDRDHRWPRVQAAYDLITQGKALHTAVDAETGLKMAYERGETDEFVEATSIVPEGEQPVRMEEGDVVIFMNYRSDRARQITRPFIEDDFDGFELDYAPKLDSFVTLTEYNAEFDIPVAFPAERLKNVFGSHIASLGMTQLRIAETEKYAHVTFFFNGGVEAPSEGEDRILVPSPLVRTYDLQPEMSATELTDHLVKAIEGGQYDVIICNYANTDMVGHTGKFDAAVKAVEAVDYCLGRVKESMAKVGGEMMITADHGNSEQMVNAETGQVQTSHTTNPVPLIYVGRKASLAERGALSDLAPSLLHMMDIKPPSEMTGRSLLEFDES